MIVHAAPWVVPISRRRSATAPWRSTSDRVAAVGRARGAARELGELVEHRGVLMPGLVNAHTHLELSHVRVPGGDGLVPWMRRLLATRTPTNVDASRARRAKSMAARGTVAAVDISNDGGTAPLWAEAGIEARVLIERIAPRGEPPASRVRGARDGARRLQLRPGGAAHAGGAQRRAAGVDPRRGRSGRGAWLVEGAGPFADFLAERDALPSVAVPGMRPIAWLDSLGVLGPGTLLVHLTVADDDVARARRALRLHRRPLPALEPAHRRRLPPVGGMRAGRAARGARHRLARLVPTLDVLGDVQALARAGVDAGVAACARRRPAAPRDGRAAPGRARRSASAPG